MKFLNATLNSAKKRKQLVTFYSLYLNFLNSVSTKIYRLQLLNRLGCMPAVSEFCLSQYGLGKYVYVCDSNANCSNTRGSYICNCRAGYTGDGKTCQGRFENVKLTQRVRDVFLYTNQKQISPIVLLKHPLVFPYCSLVICVPFSDVDECNASSPVCDSNANCSNTRGSYICTCRAGYTGDGKTCRGRFENVRSTQRVREVF